MIKEKQVPKQQKVAEVDSSSSFSSFSVLANCRLLVQDNNCRLPSFCFSILLWTIHKKVKQSSGCNPCSNLINQNTQAMKVVKTSSSGNRIENNSLMLAADQATTYISGKSS